MTFSTCFLSCKYSTCTHAGNTLCCNLHWWCYYHQVTITCRYSSCTQSACTVRWLSIDNYTIQGMRMAHTTWCKCTVQYVKQINTLIRSYHVHDVKNDKVHEYEENTWTINIHESGNKMKKLYEIYLIHCYNFILVMLARGNETWFIQRFLPFAQHENRSRKGSGYAIL